MLQSSYDGFVVSSIKMATQLSTKVGVCTHFSVFGYWMKQCESCLKYYCTLSLPFEQRLVFRLCRDVHFFGGGGISFVTPSGA